MYSHYKQATGLKFPVTKEVLQSEVNLPGVTNALRSLPASSAELLTTPGKAVEALTVADKSPEETPFRGYEDLKEQYFGPTLINKQRLWELGDTLAYQGAYGLPAAAIGGVAGGPAGMFGGLALGKLLGQAHLLSKEKERLAAAKKYFSKNERKALKTISQKSKNWAIGSGLLAGLGVGGLSALAGQDRFGKIWTPLLEGAAAASLAGLGGSLLGQHLAQKELLQNTKFAPIIQRYSYS
jgi:hypothetical protein